MKRKSALVASLLGLAALLSLNVHAASDTPADAKSDASTSSAPPKKGVRPHSHLEEKTGIISKKSEDKPADQATSDAPKAKKTNPAKDKSKHFHPRDSGKN